MGLNLKKLGGNILSILGQGADAVIPGDQSFLHHGQPTVQQRVGQATRPIINNLARSPIIQRGPGIVSPLADFAKNPFARSAEIGSSLFVNNAPKVINHLPSFVKPPAQFLNENVLTPQAKTVNRFSQVAQGRLPYERNKKGAGQLLQDTANAVSFIPVAGLAGKAPLALKALKMGAASAPIGVASSIGSNLEKGQKVNLKDAAISGAVTGAFGAAAPVIGKAVSKIATKAPGVPKVTETPNVAQSTPTISLKPEAVAPTVTEAPITPAQKVIQALQDVKATRRAQDAGYSPVRASRLGQALNASKNVGGEKGYYAGLSKLKGALPTQEFQGIADKLNQSEIDQLFTELQTNPDLPLRGYDRINAQGALMKVFGKAEGVPTRSEIRLLGKAFGPDFAQAVSDNISTLQKMKELGYEVANVPRSLMASLDLSAPFRQGLVGGTRYPKQFLGAFRQMFKYAGSENAYEGLQQEIASRPNFKLMQRANLALTSADQPLAGREEQFMSNLAERIPGAGKLVRASDRAYTGFLNKFRADVFDHLVEQAGKSNMDAENPKFLHDLGTFINTSTGRGNLGALERGAVALNSFFFSPRLAASRLQLFNPAYYAGLDPFVRQQALQSAVTLGTFATTVLALAKLGGAEVVSDPRNADFGKVKVGNTRVDVLGGHQQYIRLAAQLASGKVISSTSGKEITLGDGYKSMTRLDVLGRFIQSKENPNVSFITDALRGKDFTGQPFNLGSELASRLIPLNAQDSYGVLKDQGPAAAGIAGALGTVGFGVQNYGGKSNPTPGATGNKSLDTSIAKVKNESAKNGTIKDYLTKEDSALAGLKASEQQKLVDEGAVTQQEIDRVNALKRTATQIVNGTTVDQTGLAPDEVKFMQSYKRLSAKGRAKFNGDPMNVYDRAAIGYKQDKAEGTLTPEQDRAAQKKLATLLAKAQGRSSTTSSSRRVASRKSRRTKVVNPYQYTVSLHAGGNSVPKGTVTKAALKVSRGGKKTKVASGKPKVTIKKSKV